jgi:hypothetical protein
LGADRHGHSTLVAVLVDIAILLPRAAAADPAAADSSRCLTCHGMRNLAVREAVGQPLSDYSISSAFASSVHGRLTCVQCHGDAGPFPHQQRRAPVTCAQDCHARDRDGRVYSHAATVADFEASVHRSGTRGDPRDRPTCLSCHGHGDPHAIQSSKELPPRERMALCDGCHDDRARMLRSGVDPDAVPSYRRSFHYKAITFGGRQTAVCPDCHTAHRIRRPSDPTSSVAAAALPATCGKATCHQGAGPRFAVSGANHLDLRVRHEPILRAEEWLFRLLTAGTMALLLIGIVLDVQRRFGWVAVVKRASARARHAFDAVPAVGRHTIRIARRLLVE